MRRIAVVAAVVLSALVICATADQQTPVFRTGINLVQVDAIVTGRDGRPLLDLQASDFALFDDGERMAIRSVRLLGTSDADASTFAPIRTADDEQREASRDGVRVFAIVLDDYHVTRAQEMRVIPALRAFVERLPPTDLLGVYGLYDSVNDAHLGRDRAPALRAISAFYGRKGEYTPKYPIEEEHLRYPMDIERIRRDVTRGAIQSLATHLGGLTEGRKTMLIVSEGFAIDFGDALELTAAANQANVAIYPIDPRGLLPANPEKLDVGGDSAFQSTVGMPRPLPANVDLLRQFAIETGGSPIVNTNNFRGGLDRVARDSSAYYLLAYESPHPDDGKYHGIKVTVARRGVDVRARSGYRAFKERQRTTAAVLEPVAPPVNAALAQLADATRPNRGEPAVQREGAAAAAPPSSAIGKLTLAIARSAGPGEPTSSREFTRSGVLVLRAQLDGAPSIVARLLGRDGHTLTELPVALRDGQCEVRLSLPGLGQGDYVLELTAQLGGRSSQQYVAFRVTR